MGSAGLVYGVNPLDAMKPYSIILSLIFMSGAITACGNDAPEQCEALFTAVCQKFSDCLGADFDTCFDANANSPPACSEADDVSSSYDQCLDEVRSASCAVVQASPNELPPSCANVILFD